MVKKDLPPILKESGEKPTIHCLQCQKEIEDVDLTLVPEPAELR